MNTTKLDFTTMQRETLARPDADWGDILDNAVLGMSAVVGQLRVAASELLETAESDWEKDRASGLHGTLYLARIVEGLLLEGFLKAGEECRANKA